MNIEEKMKMMGIGHKCPDTREEALIDILMMQDIIRQEFESMSKKTPKGYNGPMRDDYLDFESWDEAQRRYNEAQCKYREARDRMHLLLLSI